MISRKINIFREFDHSANIGKQFCLFSQNQQLLVKVFDDYKKNNHFHEKKNYFSEILTFFTKNLWLIWPIWVYVLCNTYQMFWELVLNFLVLHNFWVAHIWIWRQKSSEILNNSKLNQSYLKQRNENIREFNKIKESFRQKF